MESDDAKGELKRDLLGYFDLIGCRPARGALCDLVKMVFTDPS